MYDKGRGVPKDDAEAAKWSRKAAEQGNATAQTNLGDKRSKEGLQARAEALIRQLAPKVNLAALTPAHGSRSDTFFFRWEDRAHPGGHFIQAGYNIRGELLNYFNALIP